MGKVNQSPIKAGASGYLLKDTESEKLSATIRSVNEGNNYFALAEQHKNAVATADDPVSICLHFEPLSVRELEVIELIAKGKSNKEIGLELFLSEGTVKNYVTKILSTLNLRDRTQIAIWSHQSQHGRLG